MMDRRTLLASGVAAAALPLLPAMAQDVPKLPPALLADIRAGLEADRIPALGLAAVKDGRIVAAEAFGLASIPFKVPARPSSLFHLGSVSKQFTAATVVALAREGRIGLGDRIGRHVHDLPVSLAGLPVAALLSHTSGVRDYGEIAGFDSDRHVDRATFLKKVGELPPLFAPGEAWSYSNTGYMLLGYLIADVTGRTYHEAVTERLLSPTRLQDSRFDDATALIPGRVEPYVRDGEQIRHATRMESEYSGWPDGGLLMSSRDAGRWEAMLQDGGALPAADLKRMTAPVSLATGRSAGYGFAWFTDRSHGRYIHYHTGSVPGFLAFYMRFPAARLGVVTMVNIQGIGGGIARRRAALAVAEAIVPGTTFLSLRPIRDGEPALTRQALALLSRGDTPLDPALFAPEITRLLPSHAGDVPPPVRPALGHPSSFELVEAYDEGRDHVRRYRATYGTNVEHHAFGYDPAGRIFRTRMV